MNSLAPTIPLYIAENVSTILTDALYRIHNLQSKNELMIQKFTPKDNVSVPTLANEIPPSVSSKSENHLLVHMDSSPKFKTEKSQKYEILQSELVFLSESLKSLQNELVSNGQFTKFSQILYIEKSNNTEFSKRETFKDKFSNQLATYVKHQNKFESLAETEVNELRFVLMNLKNNKQEFIQKHKMELKVLEKQNIQNALALKDVSQHEIGTIFSEIEKYQQLTAIEMRGSQSLQQEIREECFSISITNDEAIKKYNYLKEEFMGSINKYQKNIKNIKDQIRNLLFKYKKYKVVVEKDDLMKEQMRIEAKKQERLGEYVKVIQNWWRWLVVKNDLISKQKAISKKPKK